VHRDIKPENIFVRENSCILGDFGLLKFLVPTAEAEDIERDRKFFIESTGPRLPRFYRSPDLLAYCKDNAELTPKSDVFQLGLVFTEMFTGVNPLREPKNIYDEIVLDAIPEPKGALAPAILSLLQLMLTIDVDSRPTAEDLLDRWEGIFLESVKISHQLEGRIF
jgi:serine/threonine protein kinase